MRSVRSGTMEVPSAVSLLVFYQQQQPQLCSRHRSRRKT